ncbi:ADP-ribose pyrophosphatase [Bizionia echini]|uniref:GDP-mannose pyrophosphatase n=1 Tax=Bizionia echini TaxID=649333 RepID=A0A1I5AFA6_9FLAO|nr:NUDIX hydrolase [Bizionia echini]SFN61115.1 ADP-ribose pyrophosphatase [Bizionia echini]
MTYHILEETTVFDDFFRIKKAKIKHDLFSSGSVEINRFCFERGDSVAIVIYEKDTDSLLFTNQFRYPTVKKTDGWILELTAGSLEADEDPEQRVKIEVEEEIGYTLTNLVLIGSFFVSPGGSSERVLLYYTEVASTDKVFEGGGMHNEKEDIQLVKIPVLDTRNKLKNFEFQDAKTLVGLQWFLFNK